MDNSTQTVLLKVVVFNNTNIGIYGSYEKMMFKLSDIEKALQIRNSKKELKLLEDYYIVKIVGEYYLTEVGFYELCSMYKKTRVFELKRIIVSTIVELRLLYRNKLNDEMIVAKNKINNEIDGIHIQVKEQFNEKVKLLEQEYKTKYTLKKYEQVEKSQYIQFKKSDGDGDVESSTSFLYFCNSNPNSKSTVKIHTSNYKLLQTIIYYILSRYQSNRNKHIFDCNFNHVKNISIITEIMLDTLKSSYEHISKHELIDTITMKLMMLSDTVDNNNEINEDNKSGEGDRKSSKSDLSDYIKV